MDHGPKAATPRKWGLLRAGLLGAALGGGWLLWTDPDRSAPFPPWQIEEQGTAEGSDLPGGLHVAFQAGDCPETTLRLNDLVTKARHGGVPVHGVLLGGDGGPEDAARMGEELEVSFPFSVGSHRAWTRFLRSLGLHRTPTVLLVDGEGRLRRAVPGDGILNRQTEILDHALELVDEVA